MTDKNNIEDLFRNTLENYESDVNPALWDKIQAGISASPVNVPTGSVAAGKSVIASWIAGGVAVMSVVGITAYFIVSNNNPELKVQDVKESTSVIQQPETVQNQISENSTTVVSDKQIAANSGKQTSNSEPRPESIINKHENQSVVAPLAVSNATKPESSNQYNLDLKGSEPVKVKDATADATSNPIANQATNATQVIQPAESTPDGNFQSNIPPVEPQKKDNDISNYFGTLPNVFTPDGNGINDLFMVKPVDVKSFSVTIFDRSGKVIHSWNSPYGFWDGLLKNGEQAPQGTYFYSIIAETLDGTVLKKQNSITLKR